MSEHTKEAWKVRRFMSARRIKACVKACEGLTNEELETLKMLAGSDVHTLRRQVDKLREACGIVVDDIDELHIIIEEVQRGDNTLEAVSRTVSRLQNLLRRHLAETETTDGGRS